MFGNRQRDKMKLLFVGISHLTLINKSGQLLSKRGCGKLNLNKNNYHLHLTAYRREK